MAKSAALPHHSRVGRDGVECVPCTAGGILMAAGVGGLSDGYSLSALTKDVYAGFGNMQEIFLLSMLIGGMGELMNSKADWRSHSSH